MIRVYADINCPFCYALNEWVQEAGLEDAIDWRVVDHNPRASFRAYTDTELVALTQEVQTIRQRAPDIMLSLPQGRSNVLDAGRLLCAVRQRFPEKYGPLRTAIYRAYWTDGVDIEQPEVLDQLAAQLGLHDVDIPEIARATLTRWTAEWEDGPHDRRIPAIVRGPNDSLLGLSPKAATLAYLRNEAAPHPAAADACSYIDRVTVAALGDWASFWPYAERLRGDSEILYHAAAPSLAEAFEQPSAPDLVIVTMPEFGDAQMAELARVSELTVRNRCPLLLLTSVPDDAKVMDLYRMGCSEVLALDRSIEIALHKIQQLIDHRKALSQLLENSLTDSLTQLYNRRKFTGTLEQEWFRSSRTLQPVSVLILDIDRFKNYNDLYGHLAGDGCLREIADLIQQQATRSTDCACRIGGEEFGIVLASTDAVGAARIAARILAAIRGRAIPHGDSPLGFVSVSIGGTTARFSREVDANTLFAKADAQLYLAKNAGRNTYRSTGDASQ